MLSVPDHRVCVRYAVIFVRQGNEQKIMTNHHSSEDESHSLRGDDAINISRDAVKNTVLQLQSGELTPAQASEFLLSLDAANSTQRESLKALIDRLGAPPTDVVDSWCQQMAAVAAASQQATGLPLDQVDMSDWSMDAGGYLSLNEISSRNCEQHCSVDPVSALAIDNFRASVLGDPQDTIVQQESSHNESPLVTAAVEESSEFDRPRDTPSASPRSPQKESFFSRWFVAALSVVGVIAIVGILIYVSGNSGDTNTKTAQKTKSKKTAVPKVITGVDSGSTPNELSTDPVGQAALATFDDAAPMTSGIVDVDTVKPIEIDPIVPVIEPRPATPKAFDSNDAASVAPEMAGSESPTESDSDSSDTSAIPVLKPLGDDDGDTRAPAETPQPTRKTNGNISSIRLANSSPPSPPVTLWESNAKAIGLEFPYKVPLSLSDDGTQILDPAEQAIALIEQVDGVTRMRLAAAAKKSSSASFLFHGRLENSEGNFTYFRPAIQADSYVLSLQRPDVRPTWDLTQPIQSKVTRISVNIALPEKIELGWIEPIDPAKIKRTSGLAVLKMDDSESVSLGMRFDIRCSRKLSCRVRFAAKLDREAPWNIVSSPLLNQFADQLTTALQISNQQSSRMSNIYKEANTDDRRRLRPMRDSLEQRIKTMQTYLERTRQLQSLIARIESTAKLNVRVWVQWKDREQTILTTEIKD